VVLVAVREALAGALTRSLLPAGIEIAGVDRDRDKAALRGCDLAGGVKSERASKVKRRMPTRR
jgi:hypothetical protein